MAADDSDSAQPLNPYSAPESVVEPVVVAIAIPFVKATRMQRLSAFVFDLALCAVPLLPLMLSNADTFVLCLTIGFALACVVLAAQLMLLHQNGWTVGKRALRIKVVRIHGEPAGVGRTFGLRICLPAALSMFPLCCIPIILIPLGGIWPWSPSLALLLDPLLIFGRAQRCAHDYVADTIVVKA